MAPTIDITVNTSTVIRILGLGFIGFILSMLLTPIYTNMAYKWEWWKKPRSTTVTGEKAKMFSKLHAKKHERHIPTMAGIVFVLAVTIVTILLNLERSETWLPLAAFAGAGMIGLLDDIINVRGSGAGVAGLPSKIKLLLTILVASIGDIS